MVVEASRAALVQARREVGAVRVEEAAAERQAARAEAAAPMESCFLKSAKGMYFVTTSIEPWDELKSLQTLARVSWCFGVSQ